MIHLDVRAPRWANARHPWLLAVVCAGIALVVSAALLHSQPPLVALAAPVVLAAVVAVLRYPFGGLIAVTFGSQTAGLINLVRPGAGGLALEAVAALAIIGAVVNGYREPKRERLIPNTLPMRLAVLSLLAAVLSSIFAASPDLALNGLRQRLNLLLLFWLILRLVKSTNHLRTLTLAVVLSTLVSTGLAAVAFATDVQIVPSGEAESGERASRQVGAAAMGATASSRMMLVGTALAAVVAYRRRIWPRACVAAAFLGCMGIFLTASRSTSLVLVLGCAWLLLKVRRERRTPLAIAVGALALLLVLSIAPAQFWERFAQLNQPSEDPTLGRRWGYQLIGLDLLAGHPILGVGPGNYPFRYTAFEYRFIPGRLLEPRDLHNMYLSVLVETGFLGIACFGGLLLVALVEVTRARRRSPDPDLAILAEAVQFSLVLLLVASLVGAAETSKYLWVLLGMAAAAGRLSEASEPWPGRNPAPQPTVRPQPETPVAGSGA